MLVPDRAIDSYFFDDSEIDAFLTMEGDTVKKAAALALEIMASDEAYVQKAIRLMDLTTNGPATAAALMSRAKLLRDQADAEAAAASTVGEFDIAEWVVNDFSGRERVEKEALRDGV
jgi:hypothetical protein